MVTSEPESASSSVSKPPKRRSRGRMLLSIAVVAIAALLLYRLGAPLLGPQGPKGMPPAPVRVATVGFDEFVDLLEALGTARAKESVQITAKVTESVRSLRFEDGARVDAGQVLAELTDTEQSADLDAARAAFVDAEKQYQRIADLVSKGSAARSELDRRRADRDSAQARVAGLEARLEDRIIRAPFAGVLGLRAVSPGTLVRPGDLIVTLDDTSLIKVDFSVPETFISALKPDLEILAQCAAYPNETFKGIVRTIDTRVDPVTRTIVVRAEVPNPDGRLRPGMLMSVELIKNRQRSLVIPEEALVPMETKQFVLMVKNGKAERREVEIGRRRPGAVEVLKGLAEGDQVIVEGTNRAMPGMPVKVLADEAAMAGAQPPAEGRAVP